MKKSIYYTRVEYLTIRVQFLYSISLMTVVFLIACIPYIEQLLADGYCMEGEGYLGAYLFAMMSEKSMLFVPIAASLAAGNELEEEMRSRYVLFSCIRTTKIKYLVGKTVSTAVRGGMAILSAALLLLVVLYVWVGKITILEGYCEMITAAIVPGSLLRCFLNGALWSLVGNCMAIITKNRYMQYAAPFILYYVLSVFQERYYPQLLILSPKQWAVLTAYHNDMGVGILFLLVLFISMFLMVGMERRICNV